MESASLAFAASPAPESFRPFLLPQPTLAVHVAGSWFQLPDGSRVACARPPVLRLLLAALARARRERPGEPVPTLELYRACWPDERMYAESARNRLKQSVAALRRLGLEHLLVRVKNGYLLTDEVPFELAAEGEGGERSPSPA